MRFIVIIQGVNELHMIFFSGPFNVFAQNEFEAFDFVKAFFCHLLEETWQPRQSPHAVCHHLCWRLCARSRLCQVKNLTRQVCAVVEPSLREPPAEKKADRSFRAVLDVRELISTCAAEQGASLPSWGT